MSRSIPARTGEPLTLDAASNAPSVYPRAYGGTEIVVPPVETPMGLSPRVRGNRKL